MPLTVAGPSQVILKSLFHNTGDGELQGSEVLLEHLEKFLAVTVIGKVGNRL